MHPADRLPAQPHSTCLVRWEFLFFSLKKKNHYLFLPVLGLHCYTWAFFSCSKQGVFFVAVCRASHCGGFLLWSMGSGAQPQELLGRGSVAPWHVGSSWTRDGTRVPPYSQADS